MSAVRGWISSAQKATAQLDGGSGWSVIVWQACAETGCRCCSACVLVSHRAVPRMMSFQRDLESPSAKPRF